MAGQSPPATLDYAARPARRRAAWWLWTLAAIVLLGGALWLVVPDKLPTGTRARVAAARADVQSLRVALDAFQVDNGRYPTALEGLGALARPPAGLANWHGPYVRGGNAVDPWGRAYEYLPPGPSPAPRVRSLGPDGTPGTKDDVEVRSP